MVRFLIFLLKNSSSSITFQISEQVAAAAGNSESFLINEKVIEDIENIFETSNDLVENPDIDSTRASHYNKPFVPLHIQRLII